MLRPQISRVLSQCSMSLHRSRIASSEYSIRRDRLATSVSKTVGNMGIKYQWTTFSNFLLLFFSGKNTVILLRGSSRSFMAPDVPHAFRQCSHFRYLTGITVPGCSYIIYTPSRGPQRRILLIDRRTEYEQLWEGSLPSDSQLENTASFDEVLPTNKTIEVLGKLASKETVLFLETSDWDGSDIASLRNSFASVHGIRTHIDQLRFIKSKAEIESMRDVCGMGAQMMSATIAGCRNYYLEGAIVGLLDFEARRRGADMLSYPPVVAAGDRANTIHYLDANQTIDNGDCVLVDAGCELDGYVSDITRSFPISGHWTDHQRTLYEALRYVHEQLLTYANDVEKIRLSNLYRRMNELIAAMLLDIGLVPRSIEKRHLLELAEQLCPHHVSHYLGMDVHDCATISRDIDLPEGVVFTIEPGLYIPQNCSLPVEFRGIGFRIEDDVATTSNGIEVLTDGVPRLADELEYLMDP